MIQIHLPTGKVFQNRKEAKDYFGVSRYRKLIKDKEILFTDYIAFDELQENYQQDSGTQS